VARVPLVDVSAIPRKQGFGSPRGGNILQDHLAKVSTAGPNQEVFLNYSSSSSPLTNSYTLTDALNF